MLGVNEAAVSLLEVAWDFSSKKYFGMPVDFSFSVLKVETPKQLPKSLLHIRRVNREWDIDIFFISIV